MHRLTSFISRLFITAAISLALGGVGFAQGVQTARIGGVVKDQQDAVMPGVTVTASSTALQGPRTVVTDAEGFFSLPGLPAGDYELLFELSGFGMVTRMVTLPLGQTIDENVVMGAAGVAETVQVTASLPGPVQTPIVGANFKHETIESLATPRTLQGIAQLSPAVNENSVSTNQVVINGAFAFDNVFMINGVDVNDNLRAQPQSLFIEDAIQETQILTSGISAEYGRFTGGVINAITKSGGNNMSGSLRVNFVNPVWTAKTPIETADHLDQLDETYEATFGGPVMRDRLWFFTSGRLEDTDSSNTLPVTLLPYTQNNKNKRGEIKLTGTIARGQTLQGGYLNNSLTTTNGSGAINFLVDPNSLDVVKIPNHYYFTNYRGFVRNSLFEAQYSERRWMTGGGGTSKNIVDSPFFAATLGAFVFNAPYFDATDLEERNNRQLTGSMTNFWNRAGRHETKTGYEFFRSQRTGGGSQSPTSYVFESDFLLDAGGKPVLDSTGHLIPTFVPGTSAVEFYPAIRGSVLNVDNNSFYVQDRWSISDHWSAALGARFEHVKAESTGGIVGVDSNRIVPRLSTAYDVQGNGNHVVHVTYGQYSGRYNDAQIGGNSPVGRAPELVSVYRGPAGQGRDFAAGFNVANYPVTATNSAIVVPPPSNVSNAADLKSPIVHEFTASYGANLWNGKGFAEATYVGRKTTGMIEDFQTLSTGTTNVVLEGVNAGLRTNKIYDNTDLATRQYQGLVFQSNYRIMRNLEITGHYTVQLKNEGNYEGETNAVAGQTSLIGNFPEAFNATRFYPDGRLNSFQRYRLRLWTVYNVMMGRAGDLSVSGLWRVDSGRVYSLTASIAQTATQTSILANAGYPDGTTSNTVFFSERGSESFKGYGLFDTSVNYNVPVFRQIRPWIKMDVFNLFNNNKLISWNTAIRADAASPKDALGLATGYTPGALFGKATSTANFPGPFSGLRGGRTFRLAIGFRF